LALAGIQELVGHLNKEDLAPPKYNNSTLRHTNIDRYVHRMAKVKLITTGMAYWHSLRRGIYTRFPRKGIYAATIIGLYSQE
jgi:hypothetical protein